LIGSDLLCICCRVFVNLFDGLLLRPLSH
jgi:hypothetical protein